MELPKPPAYLKAIQVSTASVSFLASGIIVLSITCCGNAGLSTPSRRIISGLSIADVIQSLAQLAGPASVPPDGRSGEAGTEVPSCKANGFANTLGASAVMMYTFFLCLYYLCKLKYRMSDDAFRHRIETKLHCFIVIFSVVVSAVGIPMDIYHINPGNQSFCGIGYTPSGCDIDPNAFGECDPTITKRVTIFGFIFLFFLPVICFLGIIVTMALLYQHAYVLSKSIEEELKVPTSLRADRSIREEEDPLDIDDEEPTDEETGTENPQDRLQNLSRLYRKTLMIQASCYVGAFIVTYIPILIATLFEQDMFSFLNAFIMFFFPLGGFLNILVHTRPSIASLRRSHPECSWLRGFWLVLRAGGEIPDEENLSGSCCDCCRPPAWLESEYDTIDIGTPPVQRSGAPTSQAVELRSMHLSRVGF